MSPEPGERTDPGAAWPGVLDRLRAVAGGTAAQRRARRSAIADAALDGLARAAGVAGDGVALAAVGSLGRRVLSPHSDLDLMLLFAAGDPAGRAERTAERLWYPIWDCGMSLDHTVLSVPGARELARRDLPTLVGMLDLRHIAGDPAVTQQLSRDVLADWRLQAPDRFAGLRESCRVRAERSGELASATVVNLKESRGGLRDLAVMRAIAASWVADYPRGGLAEAQRDLLDTRDALRKLAGRAVDRIQLQDQDALAAATGFGDRDALMRRVADVGRTVAGALDLTWYAADRVTRARSGRGAALRSPLADGVVEQGGEAVLARDADPADPAMPLRLAAAAARAGIPMSRAALTRLLRCGGAMPVPWPPAALRALVELLGAGEPLVAVWEDLERAGVISDLLPGWDRLRSLPQRDPVHRYTVDRHLVRTAVRAAGLVRRVSRPDRLLLAALLHDIGKGSGSDHSAAGAALARRWLARMGVAGPDADEIGWLVAHHLLLSESVTRSDPDDPDAVAGLAAAVGSAERLELLLALTEADATAAGPRAWTAGRAAQVMDLAGRVRANLAGGRGTLPGGSADPGGPADSGGGPADSAGGPAGGGGAVSASPPAVTSVSVRAAAGTVEVLVDTADRPGLLALVASVLAGRGLTVRSVTAGGEGCAAHQRWLAEARFGAPPDAAALRAALVGALAGAWSAPMPAGGPSMRTGRPAPPGGAAAPVVRVVDGPDPGGPAARPGTVLEVRAPDLPGLVAAVAAAVGESGVDIVAATADTYGSDAVDVFHLRRRGLPLDPDRARALVAAVTARLTGPPPG